MTIEAESSSTPTPLNTASPCKRICRLVDDRCTGCGRTLLMIARWSKLSPELRDQANTQASAWLKNEEQQAP